MKRVAVVARGCVVGVWIVLQNTAEMGKAQSGNGENRRGLGCSHPSPSFPLPVEGRGRSEVGIVETGLRFEAMLMPWRVGRRNFGARPSGPQRQLAGEGVG